MQKISHLKNLNKKITVTKNKTNNKSKKLLKT